MSERNRQTRAPEWREFLAQKRRTRRRYLSWLALIAAPPAAGAVWLGFVGPIEAAWLPAPVAGILGVLAAVALVWALARARLGRLDRAPLSADVLRELDRLRGVERAAPGPRVFWQDRLDAATGDRWAGLMAIAVAFAVLLNTATFWGPIAASALGKTYVSIESRNEPVVRIVAMRVVSPIDGVVSDHSSSDGFIQVHEGADVAWLVEPAVPATYVTMLRDERRVTRLPEPDGVYAFDIVAERSETYRFRAGRWGVGKEERLGRRIEVLPDLPPEPFWLERPPAESDGATILAYAWRAQDDRAVTSVVLEIAGADETIRIDLFAASPGTATTPAFRGRIDPSELPRGDEVTLTLLAFDNDRLGGPNLGRSDPVVVRMRTVEESHEEWKSSLLAYLNRQVRFLGVAMESSWRDEAWIAATGERVEEAADLARTGRELAEVSGKVEMRSRDATDALLTIARHYDRLRLPGRPAAESIGDVEEAVFRTDELLGLEEAAGMEHRENRLINRLEQLSDDITGATDAELERMFQSLLREMADMAETAKSKRPQLPTELMQRDAFRPEKQSERADLMQQIRDAIRQGDRERAQALMQRLIEQLKQAREAGRDAASEAREGAGEDPSELARRREEIDALQRRQEEAAQRMQAAQEAIDQAAGELDREFRRQERMSPRQSPEGQALHEAEEAIRKGDRAGAREAMERLGAAGGKALADRLGRMEQAEAAAQGLEKLQEGIDADTATVQEKFQEGQRGSAAVQEALDNAREKMDAAGSAAGRGQPGEGASQGWQAAEALKQAGEAVGRQIEQARDGRSGENGFAEYRERPGNRGESDEEVQGDEAFDAPLAGDDAAGDREKVLQGFRGGLPDPGRSVNERYLDRLLH